ncbi:LIM-domain binding protein-domain-containing protein [Scleroderma yunnanense]
MRPPVGFGQGCICLLQFSDQLSNENPSKHQLSFWNSWVKESFTPEASVKFTLWMDKKKVEARPIQISVFHLPRFFLVTAQCGVKSMTLSFDGAQETLYPHSHAVVKCDRAVWTYKYTNGLRHHYNAFLGRSSSIISSSNRSCTQSFTPHPIRMVGLANDGQRKRTKESHRRLYLMYRQQPILSILLAFQWRPCGVCS